MNNFKIYLYFTFLFSFLVMLSACSDNAIAPMGNNASPLPQSSSSNGTAGDRAKKIITHDPDEFVAQLKKIDNDYEVLIVLKTATSPRISKRTLIEIPGGGSIAIPAASADKPQRNTPGFANVNSQSRESIRGILTNNNLIRYQAPDFGNIITATLSTENAKGIITALLNNPNVDYIEANQRFSIKFSYNNLDYLRNVLSTDNSGFYFANPQGSNPSDLKHTYHDVLDAWDYTRGSGAKVGILDTGFSFYQNNNNPHPDGLLLTATKGIKTLGFVDDYDNYGNCNGGSGQASGNCIPWDDNFAAHGTKMAGIVGANDNNKQYVGVMPDGLTISMKVGQDCRVTGGCQDDNWVFEAESDDLNAAVTWARNNNIDVLSMSFELPAGRFNPFTTLYNNLYTAYHTDDILLVSSTGNDPNNPNEPYYPQTLDFVMGVGGLESDGSNFGRNNYQEVSALSGGGTLKTLCGGYTFCQPQTGFGGTFLSPPNGQTSTSTAIVAGIAGLVRSYHPSMTASELRQRLINTSEGPHNKVSALRAITNDIPMTVTIDGPVTINSSGNYNWEAMPEDGGSSFSYHWEYQVNGTTSWQTVGSSKIYSRYVSTSDQNFFLRVTVTSGTEQASDLTFVTVTSDDCPPLQICSGN